MGKEPIGCERDWTVGHSADDIHTAVGLLYEKVEKFSGRMSATFYINGICGR